MIEGYYTTRAGFIARVTEEQFGSNYEPVLSGQIKNEEGDWTDTSWDAHGRWTPGEGIHDFDLIDPVDLSELNRDDQWIDFDWVAMERDGTWWGYCERPELGDNRWVAAGKTPELGDNPRAATGNAPCLLQPQPRYRIDIKWRQSLFYLHNL